MSGINLGTVDPKEAIAFLRQKVNVPTKTWTDIYGEMHSRSFVVAGAMQSALLGDIHAALQKAVDTGTTMEEFRKDFDKTVAENGWDYKGGRNWRTAVIFNTNLRSAYHAGRYRQQMDPEMLKEFPNLRYVHGASLVPRPEHLAWDGVTLPATDPWWETHYGQNGWGCKCRVESAPATAAVKQPEDFGTYKWTNPSTGEVRDIPAGIDPGFDHNPGMAAGRDDAETLALEKSARWKELPGLTPAYYGRPAEISADAPKAAMGAKAHGENLKQSLLTVFEAAVGGKEAIFTGPDKKPCVVNASIVNHMMQDPDDRVDGREQYFPFIKELVEDPFEIWVTGNVNAATGKVLLRKRYVKMLQLEKNVVIGLVADSVDNVWEGMTFFRGGKTSIKNLRKGNLLWGRKK